MELKPTCDVKILGHLGLIVAIFKEYDIIDRINLYLPKKSNHQFLSHGEVIFAMVLQGLGFTNNRPYLASEFFSHLAVRELFGRDVELHHFNSDVYRRTLDAIFDYGPKRFFTDICFGIVLEYDLLKKFFYIDTTSLYVTGKKYKNKGNIELKRGYSKDHRMDLKQLVYLLVSTSDGIPIFAESHSGNVTDNELFQETIVEVQGFITNSIQNYTWVVDAALYNKDFLLNKNIMGHWISRVPESIKLCKDALERNYDDLLWNKIDNNYKYLELESEYGGKKQRWILVRNRKSKYKELDTFNKNLDKEEVIIENSIKKLQKKIFYTKEEARCEIEAQRKYHSNFIIKENIKGYYKSQRGRKRKIKIGYTMTISYHRNEKRIEKLRMRKGKFILATNNIDDDTLSASEILNAYRGRNQHIESCFKFIKDRTYNLNQIYLQHEGRIEAMVAVMSLILFINNLAQKTLRNYLTTNNQKIPNQLGRSTDRPTFKWASYIMRNITSVRMMVQDKVYRTIEGLNSAQEIIIRAFGDIAVEIYGMTP